MSLLGDKVPILVALPAEALLALDGALAAVDAEEHRADDVVLSDEDVDEGLLVRAPAELGLGEDGAADYADCVGGLGGDAGFADELGY